MCSSPWAQHGHTTSFLIANVERNAIFPVSFNMFIVYVNVVISFAKVNTCVEVERIDVINILQEARRERANFSCPTIMSDEVAPMPKVCVSEYQCGL